MHENRPILCGICLSVQDTLFQNSSYIQQKQENQDIPILLPEEIQKKNTNNPLSLVYRDIQHVLCYSRHENLDYIFVPGIRDAVKEKQPKVTAYAVKDNALESFELEIKPLTDDERQIILDGCLINYYKSH